MAEIKYKYFRDVILIMPCQNSLWIMGLRIYGEGKTKILLSSPTNTAIDPLAQDPKWTGSILIQKLLTMPRLFT